MLHQQWVPSRECGRRPQFALALPSGPLRVLSAWRLTPLASSQGVHHVQEGVWTPFEGIFRSLLSQRPDSI